MSTASRRSRAVLGARIQAAVTLLIGAGLLFGGVAALISTFPALIYDSTPQCAAVTDANCRFTGSARVLTVSLNTVELQLLANGRDVTAQVAPDPSLTLPQAGETVSIEMWSGKVTQVAGLATVDNPTVNSSWQSLATIGALFVLIGLGLIVWAVRTWRRPDDELDAPSLAPFSTGGTLFNQ